MLPFAIVLAVSMSSPVPGTAPRAERVVQGKEKPKERPVVEFAGGAPHVEVMPNGSWKIVNSVYYNVPLGWEFEELRVEFYYHKMDEQPTKSSIVVTKPNEIPWGTPGTFKTEMSAGQTAAGEIITAKAILVGKHPKFGEQEWSISTAVLTPSK
jgi:hypothetical protein